MGLDYTDSHQVPKDVISSKKAEFEPYVGATSVSNADYAQKRPTRRM